MVSFDEGTAPRYEDAKLLFYKYNGSHFYMWQNGALREYEKYKVPKSIEKKWLTDIKKRLLDEIAVSKGNSKIILIDSYLHLLDDAAAIEFLIALLNDFELDTFSLIIIAEALKQFLHRNIDEASKNTIKRELLSFKEKMANERIVIDDSYKKRSDLKEYVFSDEAITNRINKI